MRQNDSAAFEDGSGLVGIDHETPDRLAARAEALHPDDGDDWDDVLGPTDDGETVDLAGIRAIPRDALQRLILWLIPGNSSPGKKRWRIAQLRLAVVASMIDSDGIARLSFEDLAGELGCTRQILSYHSLKILDGLEIEKARNGKARRSRAVYRESAIKSHRARGNRVASDEPLTDSASE